MLAPSGLVFFACGVGELHERFRRLAVLLQESCEFSGRGGGWHHCLLLQEFDEVRLAEELHEFGADAVDDRLRRAVRGGEAPPALAAVAADAGFVVGRNIGQQRRALVGADGERLHLTVLDQPHEVADAETRDLHLAGGERLRGRTAALVRHADDARAPFVVEPAQEQVRERAVSQGREVELVGLALRELLELRDRAHVERRLHEHAFDEEEEPRDRYQVGVGIVGELGEQERVVGHRAVIDDAERVAVGCRLRAGLAAENAARATFVLDDQGLAKARPELVHRRAHDHVGDAAGRDRDDQPYRPVRIVLRAGA